MTAEGDRRKAQAGRPAFCTLMRRGCPGVGQSHPGRFEQLLRLALGEPQIAGSHLREFVGEPELVEPHGRISARRQHHARGARRMREHAFELCEGI
jgi:hypothetical protein